MDTNNEIKVTPHIIMFMDILGYSETIGNGEIKKDNQDNKDEDYYLEEVHYMMSFLSEFIMKRNEIIDNNVGRQLHLSRFKSLIFSDNILFFASYESETDKSNLYMNLLYGLSAFLVQYHKQDFFFRGSITAGSLYYDENLHFVFGSGLVRACELENNVAKYPRIIIDNNLKPVEWLVGLAKDNDIWYLDYWELAYQLCQSEKNKADISEEFKLWLKGEQEVIQDKLRKHKGNERVFEKYKWLKDYHNCFCVSHDYLDLIIE